MNPMEKQITKMNTTSENMTYLVDNKTFLCQHKKLHPLTSREVKLMQEKCREIFKNH